MNIDKRLKSNVLGRAMLKQRLRVVLAAGFTLAGASSAFPLRPSAAMPPEKLAAEAGYLAGITVAMNTMMANMTITPSQNVDRDFIAMMVPHHQGAIAMAQAELAYGSNEQLFWIAQGIIVEQLQEIAAMRLAIGEPAVANWSDAVAAAPLVSPCESIVKEAPYLAQNAVAMNVMMKNMDVPPTGNVDRDFVAMMVPHHQGGIDMARAELRYGYSPQLRLIAQEIIVDQIQEIATMRLALGEKLPQSIASPTQAGATAEEPQPPTSGMNINRANCTTSQ